MIYRKVAFAFDKIKFCQLLSVKFSLKLSKNAICCNIHIPHLNFEVLSVEILSLIHFRAIDFIINRHRFNK